MFCTLVVSDGASSFAVARVMGGLAFSLGLVLVVVAGAELFTGNNLLVMAWVSGRLTGTRFLQNLVVVWAANLGRGHRPRGARALSGHPAMNGGAVGRAAVGIATAKWALPFGEAFFRAVLCNVLVCLAVWIAMAARHVTDKIFAQTRRRAGSGRPESGVARFANATAIMGGAYRPTAWRATSLRASPSLRRRGG
jgi:formate/nitrite transporter FocA (FNT family)